MKKQLVRTWSEVHQRKMISIRIVLFLVAGNFFYWFAGITFSGSLLAVFLLYVVTGGWRFLKVVIVTLPRDLRGAVYLIDIGSKMRRYRRNCDTIVTLFEQTVQQYPDKVALVMVDGKSWTFHELDLYSNTIANCFCEQGFHKGDVVAVFMESCVEFVGTWLGLAKLGIVTALINFNLRFETLAHCINSSHSKALIYSSELADAVHCARHLLHGRIALYYKGDFQADGIQAMHLDTMLAKSSDLRVSRVKDAQFHDKLLYIYTSGTTGLPKAAVISNSRFFYMSYSIYYLFKLRPDDIIYDTLPLYHTNGGVLSIGNCLLQGCTVVIRKKFSASRFWEDCIQHRCTVGQYIGEICRYLLAQPVRQFDRQHRVRVMFGNGLRPQIWNEFKERFGIERVGEFYGATEGNANILNSESYPGAIGFQTRLLPWVYPVTLIRVNEETGEPVRDHRSLCVRCEPGEPGLLVGKIVKGQPMREFDGYANPEATKKKIAHNVFKKGDCYFLTGDILEMDEYGYMYFRDRTGDTFRWRGENVSTSEVEAIVSSIVNLNDAVVYGVKVPGIEGRAGMAAIVDTASTVDLRQFNHDLQLRLPTYARPIFLRLLDKLDLTGTFKLKKMDYKKDGFNPTVVKDKLFYLDPKTGEYEELDMRAYNDILTGKIRI